MAVPGAMQGKIIYDPPLPPLRNQLLQRMEMGCVTKVHMFYKTNFWRPKGNARLTFCVEQLRLLVMLLIVHHIECLVASGNL